MYFEGHLSAPNTCRCLLLILLFHLFRVLALFFWGASQNLTLPFPDHVLAQGSHAAFVRFLCLSPQLLFSPSSLIPVSLLPSLPRPQVTSLHLFILAGVTSLFLLFPLRLWYLTPDHLCQSHCLFIHQTFPSPYYVSGTVLARPCSQR